MDIRDNLTTDPKLGFRLSSRGHGSAAGSRSAGKVIEINSELLA
jgi:hypothetical protein